MPHQNNIQSNNVSIDILLDLAKKLLLGQIPSHTQTEGHSQAVFIDPHFTDGYHYLDLIGGDEKTGLHTYEVQDQGYTFSWNLNLLYRFGINFGAPYVNTDVVNDINSENFIDFEAGMQLFSLGGQYWAEVGYDF